MTHNLTLDQLARLIPGGVLHPGGEGFAEAVTTMAGPGTPDLVVRPRSTNEVAAAVRFAGQQRMSLTVRSGGHSLAGLSTPPSGLLLDLRGLQAIEVDPASRLVRIGGGACWGRVARTLRPHGLGITAGDTTGVGVGGLTLGGGIGWMVRRHGLAIDSLVGAEVVTAAGRVLEVSADAHPDLFWALRGGGGNFGVVTRFDLVAQPVTDVVFGTVSFDLDGPSAPEQLLAAWAHHQECADERLTTVLSLVPAMADRPASASLGLCFVGDVPAAAPSLEPLLRLGSVRDSDVGVRPYAETLTDVDHPPGLRATVRNTFLPALGRAEAAAAAAVFSHGGTVVSLRALGGAVARVGQQDTAFAHRSAAAMVVALRLHPPGGEAGPDDVGVVPGWERLAARGTGAYVNFLSEAGEDATVAGYPGPTRRRLAGIKAVYDPDNIFRRTVNIRPGVNAA